jgi:hypothetical protein
MRQPARTFRDARGTAFFDPFGTLQLFGGGDATATGRPLSLPFNFPTRLLPLLFGPHGKIPFDPVECLLNAC